MIRANLNFQALENRRMLAADAAGLGEVAAILAADVNADGTVSARDALAVINRLNLPDLVDDAISLLDVDGDGDVSAIDALRVINRLNTNEVDLVDSVMRLMPLESVAATGEQIEGALEGLLGDLNQLRVTNRLSRVDVLGVVGDLAEIATDDTLAVGERVQSIGGTITTLTESLGLESDVVQSVLDRAGEVIDALPETTVDRLLAVAPEALDTADRVLELVASNQPLVAVNRLMGELQDLDVEIQFPRLSTVLDFISLYRTTTADGAFTETELSDLRNSAGDVLTSVGIDGELRENLLDGFDVLIRRRFD